MSLQERLSKIKDYFVSMEMVDGKWAMCVRYQPKWGAYPSEDGMIEIIEDENSKNNWWYVAKDSSVDIDSIMSLIEETIQTNLDAIRKVELFKEKATELKRIFSDETLSLAKLQTLTFTFGNVPPIVKKEEKTAVQKKSVASSKKELMSQASSEISEEAVFSAETDKSLEKKPKRSSRKERAEVNVKTVTPSEMTQDEIDDLRG